MTNNIYARYTRAQVRANREKVIAFLQEPERKKAIGRLDAGNDHRCCLGHMCFALDIKRSHTAWIDNNGREMFGYGLQEQYSIGPTELVQMVALNTNIGEAIGQKTYLGDFQYGALSSVNDKSDATTQEIGAYLATVIEGGDGTPWHALSDIPEELPK